MTPLKTLAGIASTTAIVFGGVDASVLNEVPLERVAQVAEYRVEAKQIGNVVETTFPWKDQPGIKVKYDLGEPTPTEKLKDKRDKEVITETVTDFDGGFKVDILLNEKPDTNRFCYQIEGAENYDFFYQPPLTQEEIAEGASRPPEIVGSYAVYHKTLKNHEIGRENYATGKVMHIPRPQVWSMSDVDTKVWADMGYEDGQLCVTVPQDFLNGADYPVRVDPTFGYTTGGASDQAFAEFSSDTSHHIGGVGSVASDSLFNSVSIYLVMSAGSEAVDVYTAVYRLNSGGAGSHAKVAGMERTLTVPATPAWYTFQAYFQPLVTDDYVVGAVGDGNDIGTAGRTLYVRYDAGGTYLLETLTGASSYTTLRDEDPWTLATSSGAKFSIYASYENPPQATVRINNGTVRIDNGGMRI